MIRGDFLPWSQGCSFVPHFLCTTVFLVSAIQLSYSQSSLQLFMYPSWISCKSVNNFRSPQIFHLKHQCFISLKISFMLLYWLHKSMKWIWNLYPLWNRTDLMLTFGISMNKLHSTLIYSSPNVTITEQT